MKGDLGNIAGVAEFQSGLVGCSQTRTASATGQFRVPPCTLATRPVPACPDHCRGHGIGGAVAALQVPAGRQSPSWHLTLLRLLGLYSKHFKP